MDFGFLYAAGGQEGLDFGVLGGGQLAGVLGGEGAETDFVPGLELAHLPELGLGDGGGADKAAAARAVGAEDDRHIAGEVDRADGVGVVVDVRRMQTGLAAVAPGPLRLRADEADAGAGGVIMDLVGGAEQDGDVIRGEEIGRPVRTVKNAQLPFAGERGLDGSGDAEQRRGIGDPGGGGAVDAKDIAGPEGAAGVAAEESEGEGGLAAEVIGDIEAVADR